MEMPVEQAGPEMSNVPVWVTSSWSKMARKSDLTRGIGGERGGRKREIERRERREMRGAQ